MTYTTMYDERIKDAIAFQRSINVEDFFIISRIETIVSLAVLNHLKENHVEGEPRLLNYHASLGPKVLEMPFSEVVDMCLDTMKMPGVRIENVDGDLNDRS